MKRLPALKAHKLIQALENAGFFVCHVKGSHYYLRHPDKLNVQVTVFHHRRELSAGTLRHILRSAGLTEEELLDLL